MYTTDFNSLMRRFFLRYSNGEDPVDFPIQVLLTEDRKGCEGYVRIEKYHSRRDTPVRAVGVKGLVLDWLCTDRSGTAKVKLVKGLHRNKLVVERLRIRTLDLGV